MPPPEPSETRFFSVVFGGETSKNVIIAGYPVEYDEGVFFLDQKLVPTLFRRTSSPDNLVVVFCPGFVETLNSSKTR